MKVIVLGATGDMGRRAAEVLARSPQVKQLTLAARDVKKAEALAHKLGSQAVAVPVDARDPGTLVAAMKGHDVAAGAIGPFYLYEVPMARAAIEAGVPYVSICDDHDAVQAVLNLDAEAKARGITVLTGAGWTPGLTNIMAKKGIEMLDKATEVHIAWANTLNDVDGLTPILHGLHILTGPVPVLREGRLTTVLAGTEPKTVRFPEPLGPVRVRHTGHPELVTIPRHFPELQEATLRGGLTIDALNRIWLVLTRLGLTRTNAGKERLLSLVKPLLPLLKRISRDVPPRSAAHVEVRGFKDGRDARVELSAIDRMTNLTALPHAVATLMVGRGEVNRPGVIPPEAPSGPDPDRFLASLAELGITVRIDSD